MRLKGILGVGWGEDLTSAQTKLAVMWLASLYINMVDHGSGKVERQKRKRGKEKPDNSLVASGCQTGGSTYNMVSSGQPHENQVCRKENRKSLA